MTHVKDIVKSDFSKIRVNTSFTDFLSMDVPDNAVVGRVPAKVINYNGKILSRHWCQ